VHGSLHKEGLAATKNGAAQTIIDPTEMSSCSSPVSVDPLFSLTRILAE
jgi:hypothetical protein